MKWYWKPLMFIGLFLAYLKTSEAMVQFAPRTFLGFTDPMVPIFWGYISAGLVEGLALIAFEKLLNHTKDSPTRTTSAFMVGLAVLFSIAMNIVDQKINDHSLGTELETGFGAFLYGMMGLLPIITAALIGSLRLVDAHYPDKNEQGGGGKGKGGGNQNFGRQFETPYEDVTNRSQYGGAPALQSPMRPSIPQASVNGNGHSNDKLNMLRGMQGQGGGNGKARSFPNDLEPMPTLMELRDPRNPTSPD